VVAVPLLEVPVIKVPRINTMQDYNLLSTHHGDRTQLGRLINYADHMKPGHHPYVEDLQRQEFRLGQEWGCSALDREKEKVTQE
jgi:hypothetical protein